jgi:hypothetical protein
MTSRNSSIRLPASSGDCLLRDRRERPHSRAAENRNELAPFHHSITAQASRLGLSRMTQSAFIGSS